MAWRAMKVSSSELDRDLDTVLKPRHPCDSSLGDYARFHLSRCRLRSFVALLVSHPRHAVPHQPWDELYIPGLDSAWLSMNELAVYSFTNADLPHDQLTTECKRSTATITSFYPPTFVGRRYLNSCG